MRLAKAHLRFCGIRAGVPQAAVLAQCTVGLRQRLSSDSGTFSGFSAVRQQHTVRVCSSRFGSQVSRSVEVDLGFSSFVKVCVLAELGAHPKSGWFWHLCFTCENIEDGLCIGQPTTLPYFLVLLQLLHMCMND